MRRILATIGAVALAAALSFPASAHHRPGHAPRPTPTPTATPTPAPTPAPTTVYRVAVVLINFTDDTREPYTPAFAGSEVLTGPVSTAAFYAASSWGQFTITGDVFGWWTVPYPKSPCDTAAWKEAARVRAAQQGVNLVEGGDYDHIALAFPRTSACGYTARAGSFYNGDTLSWKQVAHEIGHAQNLNHANSRICTEGGIRIVLSATCTDTEYGDYFDTMGNQSGNWFSNWHRAKLGWLTGRVVGPGTYSLGSAQSAIATDRLLMVARPDGTYFALEYRRPAGVFDQYSTGAIDGIFVRIATHLPDAVANSSTVILDMTPQTEPFWSVLTLGQSFTYDGITITTDALGPAAATVTIG